MDFVTNLHQQAAAKNQTIVLPEGSDDRMLQAAVEIRAAGIARLIILGETDSIRAQLAARGGDCEGISIIDPGLSTYRTDFSRAYFELRQHKGMTPDLAATTMQDPLFFGAMLVRQGLADGMVAGAINPTGNVLRAGFQIVGTAEGAHLVSSCFVMVQPTWDCGSDGLLVFGDCAVNPQPNAEQLAEIAITTAATARTLCGFQPRVAMLSFSTMQSGSGPEVDKVTRATALARALDPDLPLDGPLQLDAALVPAIGRQKAPESAVAGQANVLIFPDLDAGNIGYKLVQRLAGAAAIGPVLQGMAKGVNDLSRGCCVEDIVNVTAVTALQSGQ